MEFGAGWARGFGVRFGERAFAEGVPFRPGSRPLHYGWVIALVGTLGMVASVPGQTIGVNVFNEKLIEALGLSRLGVSSAYFVGTAASGFLLPYAGRLFDRLGARRMIVGASVALALSLCYMSLVDVAAGAVEAALGAGGAENWIRMGCLIFGFFLIRFFGQGLVMMTSRNMIGKWWLAHRGKVFSIGGIAVSVSFSLAPKVFHEMIEAFGWRESWRIMALVLAPGFCLVAWLLYRDNPSQCGLEVDAGIGVDAGREANPEFRLVKEFTRSEALRSFSFWAFTLVFTLQSCYFTGYAFHVIDVAADLGRESETMLNLFLPIAVLNAGVSLFVGWMSDRWRLKYLLAFMASGMVIASLGLAALEGPAAPIALVIGFGISGGCFGAISGVFMPRFFGLKNLGAISGIFASSIVIGSAVGPLAFSLARSFSGSYGIAHFAAAAFSGLLVASSFWADNPQRKLAG